VGWDFLYPVAHPARCRMRTRSFP